MSKSSITPAKSLLPQKVTYWHVRGIRGMLSSLHFALLHSTSVLERLFLRSLLDPSYPICMASLSHLLAGGHCFLQASKTHHNCALAWCPCILARVSNPASQGAAPKSIHSLTKPSAPSPSIQHPQDPVPELSFGP